MSKELDLANYYFEVSNKSDIEAISGLFTDTTTYSSQTTGMYFGRDAIVEMQRSFHGSFKSLHWHVNSVEEVKPGICLFDYDFKAEKQDGESVNGSGLEYVVVKNDKIYHVEIRNK